MKKKRTEHKLGVLYEMITQMNDNLKDMMEFLYGLEDDRRIKKIKKG